MAGEKDYSRGERLRALIISFQMNTTMAYTLKQTSPAGDAGYWEDLAAQLQRGLVNEVDLKRLLPLENLNPNSG